MSEDFSGVPDLAITLPTMIHNNRSEVGVENTLGILRLEVTSDARKVSDTLLFSYCSVTRSGAALEHRCCSVTVDCRSFLTP